MPSTAMAIAANGTSFGLFIASPKYRGASVSSTAASQPAET